MLKSLKLRHLFLIIGHNSVITYLFLNKNMLFGQLSLSSPKALSTCTFLFNKLFALHFTFVLLS